MTKKRVILHIGLHKTGSSSIQSSFRKYDDGTTAYLRMGPGPNHGVPLRVLVSDAPEDLYQSRNKGRSRDEMMTEQARYKKAFAKQLERPVERLIISGEGLSLFSPAELSRLLEMIAASGREVETVIAYVRSPLGYGGSILSQKIKGLRAPGETYAFPRYRAGIGPWIKACGAERCQVFAFDPKSFPGGSVVQHFAGVIGLDPTSITEERKNEALSVPAAQLGIRLAQVVPGQRGDRVGWKALRQTMDFIHETVEGDKLRTNPACFDYTPEREQELGWLARNTGVDFREEMEAHREVFGTSTISQWLGSPDGYVSEALGKAMDAKGIEVDIGGTKDDQLRVCFAHFLEHEKRAQRPQAKVARKGIRRLRHLLSRLRNG